MKSIFYLFLLVSSVALGQNYTIKKVLVNDVLEKSNGTVYLSDTLIAVKTEVWDNKFKVRKANVTKDGTFYDVVQNNSEFEKRLRVFKSKGLTLLYIYVKDLSTEKTNTTTYFLKPE